MNEDNWNSYLMEVWILDKWIGFFGRDLNHYYQLGYDTVSGRFDKRSGLWETMFRIVPMIKIVKTIRKTSNMMSLISNVNYSHDYSKEQKSNRIFAAWAWHKLPDSVQIVHIFLPYCPYTVSLIQLLISKVFDKCRVISVPLSPVDFRGFKGGEHYIEQGEEYIQNENGDISDSKDQVIGNVKGRIKINSIKYLHKSASFFIQWPKEESIFVKLKSRLVKDDKFSKAIRNRFCNSKNNPGTPISVSQI